MLIADPILQKIIDHLQLVYGTHTIILYGSRSRHEAVERSDYDIIAIRKKGDFKRDFTQFNSAHLDAFVYSENDLKNIDPYLIRIRDGIVLTQIHSYGDNLLKRVKKFFEKGPPPTLQWEVQEITTWLEKMFERTLVGDIESNFRLHWLLYELLGCYFKLRNKWYLGPKESFKWLNENDRVAYQAFVLALKPDSDSTSIKKLIDIVRTCQEVQ